jgi:hypothetical protein
MQRRILWITAVVVVLGLLSFNMAFAQSNLLSDPGFEVPGDFKVIMQEQGDDGVFGVPQAWSGWISTSRTLEWQNKVPNGFPHTGIFKTPADSTRSLHISRGFSTFTVAVYQRVAVPENANLTGSAWGFMERAADATTGAQWRVGIDVLGGNNPNAASVVWSPWSFRVNGWDQLTVSATAQGTAVSFFLYTTQSSPSDPNGIYFDSAVLTTGGAGGAPNVNPDNPAITNTPSIPTPAFAAFVAPQGEQSDGSIVHTVVSGDTLDAIAVAYGTTRDALLELNDLPSARFLQVGQKILIRPPQSSSASGSNSSSSASGTPSTGTPATRAATESGAAASTSVTGAATQAPGAAVQATSTSPAEPTADITGAPEDVEAEPTTAPSETPAPPTSTPTAPPPAPVTEVAQSRVGVTGVCVWMFNDGNQNRIQEETESLLGGGGIAINQGTQAIKTYTTVGAAEPFCYDDILPGNYVVSATAPDGFGLTTSAQLSLRVVSGTTTDAKFGAAEGVTVAGPPPVDLNQPPGGAAVEDQAVEPDTTSQLLQISGLIVFGLAALVLVGGVGVALIMRNR